MNNIKKRLDALEAKSAQDGILLTESQLAALEKKKDKLEALGEITTEHPGYLIAQDTYYVGTGVGKIYQQIVIDTYSRVAAAKLYTDKTPINSADILVLMKEVCKFEKKIILKIYIKMRVYNDRKN